MEQLSSEISEQMNEQATRIARLGDWKRNKRETAQTSAVGIARIFRSQVNASAARSGLVRLWTDFAFTLIP